MEASSFQRVRRYDYFSLIVSVHLLLLRSYFLEVVYLAFRTPSLLLLIPSLVPSILYYVLPGSKRSALLTDILALSFSHSALSIMKLDQFKTGVILLSGLFLYDIWWVFGTDVVRDSLSVLRIGTSH